MVYEVPRRDKSKGSLFVTADPPRTSALENVAHNVELAWLYVAQALPDADRREVRCQMGVSIETSSWERCTASVLSNACGAVTEVGNRWHVRLTVIVQLTQVELAHRSLSGKTGGVLKSALQKTVRFGSTRVAVLDGQHEVCAR